MNGLGEMNMKYLRTIGPLVLACAVAAGTLDVTAAGSLAGSEGHKYFHPVLSGNPKDECTKTYNAYKAAGGHSAYATTPYYRTDNLYIICGAALNAPTQKAAEERALKSCQSGRGHYKVTTAGACAVAASK
jgi:hypothetical protein